MRVFVCEFVTGGGLREAALPLSLAREGAMIRDALVRDLADLSGVEVVTTHDDRTSPPQGAESVAIHAGDDPWAVWAALAGSADVAWAVAPETGGMLRRLTALLRTRCPCVIGPDDETVAVASSKVLTAVRLAAQGVPTPHIWPAGAVPPNARGPFVTKPDDGAGCEATFLVNAAPPAGALPPGHIVQAFAPGEPASLTVLRADGVTRLLAANRQHVAVEDGAFVFKGVLVAALADPDGRLAALAEAVGRVLPGLSGIFGIDVVIGPGGPVVIEINPRLTTAYAGLREALGLNPAALVPPFAAKTGRAPLASRQVEIAL